MPLLTDIFRECHRLRKHLRELQTEIDRGPRVLKLRQETLEAERLEHHDHHESIKKLKLKQRDDEGTLKQTDTRLAKLEDQLTGISNQKEFDAKKSEISQAKEKKEALEDAIINTLMLIEEKMAAIPAVEKKLSDAQKDFEDFQKEAMERLARLKADQEASRAALAKAEEGIPEEYRSRYDMIVKKHGPDALAGVKDRICQGCRTKLTEQRQLEITDGIFILCSTCGKMLYPMI
jgi:predicted  nucleic acid-binding Zn-ribbon protein